MAKSYYARNVARFGVAKRLVAQTASLPSAWCGDGLIIMPIPSHVSGWQKLGRRASQIDLLIMARLGHGGAKIDLRKESTSTINTLAD